jgi:hypothetical protein
METAQALLNEWAAGKNRGATAIDVRVFLPMRIMRLAHGGTLQVKKDLT